MINNHKKLNLALNNVQIEVIEVTKAVNVLSDKASLDPDGISTLCYKIEDESLMYNKESLEGEYRKTALIIINELLLFVIWINIKIVKLR